MILILVPIMLGAIFYFAWRWSKKKRQEAAAWPSVRGAIFASHISQRKGQNYSEEEAFIAYDYVVNGRSFRANRVKFGFLPSNISLLNRYPVGAPVDVFYNPAKPSEAVLER